MPALLEHRFHSTHLLHATKSVPKYTLEFDFYYVAGVFVTFLKLYHRINQVTWFRALFNEHVIMINIQKQRTQGNDRSTYF